MSGTNLSKTLLLPPLFQEDKSEGASLLSLLRLTRYYEGLRTTTPQSVQELHQERMKRLRKDLDYLKETEWKYDPIEAYIGQ